MQKLSIYQVHFNFWVTRKFQLNLTNTFSTFIPRPFLVLGTRSNCQLRFLCNVKIVDFVEKLLQKVETMNVRRKTWTDPTWSQLNQHFTSCFYARRSHKCKNNSQVKQLFALLGSACLKAARKQADEIDPTWSQFNQLMNLKVMFPSSARDHSSMSPPN